MKRIISLLLILFMFCCAPITVYAEDCYCCDECADYTGEDECSCNCEGCLYCGGDENSENENEDNEQGESDNTESDTTDYNPSVEGTDPYESVTTYTKEEQTADKYNYVAYQYCGDRIHWYIRSNVLYLFGEGSIYDYGSSTNTAPWSGKNFNSVVIRAGITNIGDYAFYNAGIKNITIPSTVVEIGNYAFANSNITSVQFGKDLRTVGYKAFYNCKSLATLGINNNLIRLEESAFENCASLVSVRFPATLEVIEKNTFKNCTNLKTTTLRTGLKEIAYGAFSSCASLMTVSYPNTLCVIGAEAYKNCGKLVNVILPESLVTIGNSAFENCKLINKIYLNKNVGTIGTAAFKNSGLKDVTICDNLKSFDDNMFAGCTGVYVKVKKNASAYKRLKSKTNLSVICDEHDKCQLEKIPASFEKEGRLSGYYCRACGEQIDVKRVSRIHSVSLSKTIFVYNGKTQLPTVKAIDMNKKTIPAKNYRITYSKGSKKAGAYQVKIEFVGNYSGTKTLKYKINPPATSLSSVTKGSKSLKINWKSKGSIVSGYEIQYSLNSNFKNAKVLSVNKQSATAATIKNLKGGKKYHVRIRTYKTSGCTKCYSSWSDSKSATVKK